MDERQLRLQQRARELIQQTAINEIGRTIKISETLPDSISQLKARPQLPQISHSAPTSRLSTPNHSKFGGGVC